MILNTTKFKANALDIMVYLINECIKIKNYYLISLYPSVFPLLPSLCSVFPSLMLCIILMTINIKL
jgi:hypothetical protein